MRLQAAVAAGTRCRARPPLPDRTAEARALRLRLHVKRGRWTARKASTLTTTRRSAAVLLFQSQVGPDWDDDPIVDHQVRVIRAPSPEGTYRRAGTLGTEG